MKLKKGFVLRDVAGECVVVPADQSIDLDGMIKLNDTAKTLWLKLELGADREELIQTLLDEYEVDASTAARSVDRFVATLEEMNFLSE